ncbi:MAG: hypothetical protein JWQ38_3195 [Flavipsychrobacter sp.]|nr:hypothetical protein [Flavipsychrobacter sp.]
MIGRKVTAAACMCILAASYSCKKSKNSGGSTTTTNTPLVATNTGWEKLGEVKFTYQNFGFAGRNSMMPIELMPIGSEIALLYTENFVLSGTEGKVVYKGKFTPGSGDTMQITKLDMQAGGDERTYSGTSSPRFIPGSYTALGMKYNTNGAASVYLNIVSESNTIVSNHFINHDGRNPFIYPNGDVITGKMNYANSQELDFFNNTTKAWTFINRTSHDTAEVSDFVPLRFTDGVLGGFSIMYKGDKVYFAIGNTNTLAAGTDVSYNSRFLQSMPEFTTDHTYTNYPRVLSWTQEGSTFTVVVGTYPYNVQHMDKAYAYKWTEGSSSFTPIYSNIPLTGTYADTKLMAGNCTTAGTVYVWGPDSTQLASSLTVLDASGQHTIGNVPNVNDGVQIGAVKYMNGAYYGVSYNVNDNKDTKHNFHMDVIKLKQ